MGTSSGFFRPPEPCSLRPPAPGSEPTGLKGPALPLRIPRGSRLRKPHRVRETAGGSAPPGLTSPGAAAGAGTAPALHAGGQGPSATSLSAPGQPSAALLLHTRGRSLGTALSPRTDLARPAVVSACAWKARPRQNFIRWRAGGGARASFSMRFSTFDFHLPVPPRAPFRDGAAEGGMHRRWRHRGKEGGEGAEGRGLPAKAAGGKSTRRSRFWLPVPASRVEQFYSSQ